MELLDNITGIAPVTGIAPGHHRSAIKDGSKGPIGGMNVHHTLPGLCSPSWAVGHPQRTQKCINFLSIGHVQTLYSISEKSHKIMNQLPFPSCQKAVMATHAFDSGQFQAISHCTAVAPVLGIAPGHHRTILQNRCEGACGGNDLPHILQLALHHAAWHHNPSGGAVGVVNG